MNFSIFQKYEKEAMYSLPILIECSEISLSLRSELNQKQMYRKKDRSPVTICDYIIQSIIVNLILKNFPNDLIIAEESLASVQPDFLEQIQGKLPTGIDIQETYSKVASNVPDNVTRFWAIDPIDGTSGFRHNPQEDPVKFQYAIAICLIENNDCVFSAVAWPCQIPELTSFEKSEPAFFFAARNIGSFYITHSMINANSPFIRATIPPDPPLCQTLLESRRNKEKLEAIANNLHFPYHPIQATSMTKGFTLALGLCSYYVRSPFCDSDERIYDIAPFSLFVEEAGGIATTGDGNKLVFANDGFVKGTTCGSLYSIRGVDFHSQLVNEYLKAFGF